MTDQSEKGRGNHRANHRKRTRVEGDKLDYDVGYGKPPKKHRFKPGQSGNPKGRPRQKTDLECQRDLRAILMQAATIPVTTTIAGKRTNIPALEAMYLKLFAKAIDGDGPSIRFAHKLAHETMAEHDNLRVDLYQHAMRIIEILEHQPVGEKDPEGIRLLNQLMEHVNAKPTDIL